MPSTASTSGPLRVRTQQGWGPSAPDYAGRAMAESKHMGSVVVAPDSLPRQAHALTVASVACELRVDPTVGLTAADVEQRRRLYGRNLLATRERVSDPALLARQFASPVVALLAAAMTVSFSFGEWQQAIRAP